MKIALSIFRFFLSLRYKVILKNPEILKSSTSKFILPNHQALIDPQILWAYTAKYCTASPVVTEGFYNIPVLHSLFESMGAVPVSDLSAGSRDTEVLKTITNQVNNALVDGKNVLLYPSGQIAGQGYEKIFNKQSAWSVVCQMPENGQVIGVRISGLWGSMWSRAWIGKSPSFFTTMLKGIFFTFANLLLFQPRRTVTIEFEDITDQAKYAAQKGRNEFNNELEIFYNKNGEEPVLFLKHYFFAPTLKRQLPERIEFSVKDVMSANAINVEDIDSSVLEKVYDILVKQASVNKNVLSPTSNLTLDLNIDSLTLVVIINEIETVFNKKSTIEISNIKTIADLCSIAEGKSVVETLKPSSLSEHKAPIKSKVDINDSKTIPEQFINEFKHYPEESFAFDKILGCTTRKEFMLKAYVVSKIIRNEVKEKHVGIMLPALQSTTLLVMASYLAGKIPVMLNWTMGKKTLEHCIETVDLKHILTAKSFYDKVEEQLSENTKQKCIFFEKKVQTLGLSTKLSGLFAYIFKQLPNTKIDDIAVILFTSGSESAPKAVPLTHKNIVSDLAGVFNVINIKSSEILLGMLPPFHSFGFTVLTIFPLISGIKVAYTPDPTDNREVLKIIKHTQSSIILATPTFLKMILSIAEKDDLQNIHLGITGAESLHPSIIETFKQKTNKDALILEGYGITECSPVLTINPIEKQKAKSVGVFIKGVEFLITDINSFQALENGKEGMILVRGNNVFNGYPDKSISSPFVEVAEKSYYKTGDLGYVDSEGFLFITGRLKRFIKIGGEMISLPAIESVLLQKYGLSEETVLAVEGSDSIEPPQIALFSKVPINKDELNSYLQIQGFSSLVKIHKVYQIDEIPLLGTGKTDYKVLKGLIN
ncbi:MAG: AMP-binding protein [Bacteroidota bacterium]